MTNSKRQLAALLGATALGLLFANSAFAQAGAEATADAKGAPAVDADGDIVVTAEKRASSVQKVPIAITAVSGETLAQAGINDVSRLAESIPNFDFGETFGSAKLAIRGIGYANLSTGAEGSVAYNLNDVYIARPAGQIGNFYDVQRVEVLRGPQGTLYGRNATGGLINIFTNRPTAEWSGTAQVTVGNYNDLIVEGGVGGPIAPGVGVRLAFFGQNRDGYGKNVITGNDIDDAQTRAARLTLAFEPTSNFTVTVIGDIGRERSAGRGSHLVGQRGLTGEPGVSGLPVAGIQLGGTAIIKDYDIASDVDPRYRRNTGGVTIDARLDLGDITLRSISAWRHTAFKLNSDLDGTSLALNQIFYDEQSDAYSQELNLNYTSDRFDLTAGGYLFIENLQGSFWTPLAYNLVDFGLDPGNWRANYGAGGDLKTRAMAGFAQASFRVTDRLTLVAGGRYSTEKKTDDDLYTNFVTSIRFLDAANFSNPNPPFEAPFRSSKRWNSFTPKIGVNFQMDPQTLIYASVSKGFKAGIFNLGGTQVIPVAGGVVLNNPPVNPETVWAYEAGLKTRLLDNRLRVNIAGFYYDYSDLQLTKIDGQNVVLTNAASAEIYGLEVETTFNPTENLTLNLNGSWLHSQFTEFSNSDQGRPGLGQIDLAGNQLPQSPEFTLSGSVEFSLPVRTGAIVARAQGFWSSRVYFDEFNVDAVSQPSYAKFDLSLGYRGQSGVEVTAFVNNVTDKKYLETAYQSTNLTGFPVNGFLAPPRTYGVRARYNF
ncbi:MAG TPA: TonB-dependent receptor [Novosphingobium sp.]|nr:TonB-dependent receptor [Novosphingobium sp.]